MNTPVDPTWRSTDDPGIAAGDGEEFAPGQRVGRYQIRGLLGRGGMGVVYLADQIEPVRRPVALKLVRGAFADPLAQAYFEVERQALARMDHPGIAKVLEAGTTPDGLPFFAMEWVDGPTLDSFVIQAAPDLRARLDLLRQIALGAHHAHQRGVVHRDLKPGNVLVPLIDGRAVPKIIDFGIAIGVDHGGDTGEYAGTSLYMSPEQCGLVDGNVDVRSDVYSLGVMLLELLAPAGTLDALRERGVGASQLSRVLRTERPSGLTHHDATQWLSLPALRAIPRELRYVIAHATDVDRDARYGSAQALADDLSNYLADRPLVAVPATRRYLIGKFVRRHRVPIGAGAAVLAALVLGLGAAIFALLQAQAERTRAEEAAQRATREAARNRSLADFLSTVLAGIEPEQARGLDTTLLRQVLDQAAARAQRDLANDEAQLGDIEATIGRAYRSIQVLDNAEAFLGRALERQRARFGADSATALETERFLLWSISENGRENEALPRMRELRERTARALGDTARATLLADLAAGWFEYLAGNMKPAETALRRASDGLAATAGADDPKALDALGRYGVVLADSGQYDAARPVYDRVLAGYTKLFGVDDPRSLGVRNSLGILAMQQRRYADGEREFRSMLPVYEKLYGADHVQTLALALNMSGALRQQGKVAESGPYYRRAYDGFLVKYGPDHLRTLIAQNNLANYLIDDRKPAEAVALAREAVTRAREPYASNRIILGEFHFTLGKALFAAGKLGDAETELTQAWRLRSEEMGADAEDARDVAKKLAELKRAQKQEPAARAWDAKAQKP
ncbi:MAG TPA: tetratricopeptide repeat protein [Tahibacter sp.]|uniref:protein kinase domain-containing protein n=1 Tax=Tahibacter sp. TaxID=2056211 RepID=UPI002B9AEBA5|nr:tetratricopeptide repeat protein [Tahibacter sp.]HSX60343.1 tetratricopeptide repeat protein [Tahibacter sp.]